LACGPIRPFGQHDLGNIIGYFDHIPAIHFEGLGSANDFVVRYYNPAEVIIGRRMEDHPRFAVVNWHSFAVPGGDPFGGQTFERP
jgi:xylose isomerase